MNSLSSYICASLFHSLIYLSLYLCACIVCMSTDTCMYAYVEVRGQILGPVSYPPPYFEGRQSSPTTTSSRLATCELPVSTLYVNYKSLKKIYNIFIFSYYSLVTYLPHTSSKLSQSPALITLEYMAYF